MVRVTVPVSPLFDGRVVFLKSHVQDGDRVTQGAVLAEFALDKSNLIVESPTNGFVHLEAEPGMTLQGGDVFATISDTARAPRAKGAKTPSVKTEATRPTSSEAVRRLMASHGLQEEDFAGESIITESMILNAVASRSFAKTSRPLPAAARAETVSRAKLLQIRALQAGQSGGLETALSVEFHAERIVAELASRKLPESYLVVGLLRAIALSAAKEPKLTSFFSENSIHYYDRVDLGFAMGFKSPLRIGVIREANSLSLQNLASKLLLLNAHFAADTLTPDEELGATLTVSSLIPVGIRGFSPLINGFQSAIFGLGGDKSLPGYPIVVTVTYDHRVFDGFEIAQVLGEIRDYMKNRFLTELG